MKKAVFLFIAIILGSLYAQDSLHIYTTHFQYRRLERFDDFEGRNWMSYGEIGSGVHQFGAVMHVCIDSENYIYISDLQNNRIIRVDNMEGDGWVEYNVDIDEPGGITLDNDDRLYICFWGG